MSDKHIRMAILDDGVHPEVCTLAGNYLIDEKLHVRTLKKNTVTPYSHGTMCARIVRLYTDFNNVDVFSIQILEKETWRGSIEGLLKAFELCVSLDIRLINLSAGTYAYEDFARIEEAVRYLLDSDRILVAATGNRGTVTYPAYLPDVIGVEYRQELIDDAYIYCQDLLTRIDFQASSRHKIVLGGHEIDTPISNSYAAPLITAKILTILRSNQKANKNEILRLLKNNASGCVFQNSVLTCSYPLVEIPVVVLTGFSNNRLSYLLTLLMKYLQQDDYNARVATNLPGPRPWYETSFQEGVDIDSFIARMSWYFSCEIILLGITSFILPDKYKNVSLWIYGEESISTPIIDRLIAGQVLRVSGLSAIRVYELMKAVMT